MTSEQQYRQAKKIVKKKKGFYSHLSVYLIMFMFFFLINMVNLGPHDKELWFFMPMIPWGIGLALHYVSVFGLPGREKILTKEWEEREIEKEMYKLGGEVEEDYLDLNEKQILQRRTNETDWRENDLV